MSDPFILAGKSYASRLLIGTGKYRDLDEMEAALVASGAEIVTVALRRVGDVAQVGALQARLEKHGVTILPNSAGCYRAEEAVRTLRLARELSGGRLVKLEVLTDPDTLMPHPEETLRAAQMLASDGFHVMAYTTDDAALAAALEQAGCVAIMPLAAPIGSGLGIRAPENIATIVAQAEVPVLVDAGIGTASDAALAMELGCDAVLLNTAIARAREPVRMAEAMKHAVIAGRLAYRAGRMEKRASATPSSPVEGVI